MITRPSKIRPKSTTSNCARRRDQSGMAVIVVMAFIAIILIYIAANIRTLNALSHEVKWLEKTQLQRLKPAQSTVSTNSPPPGLRPN